MKLRYSFASAAIFFFASFALAETRFAPVDVGAIPVGSASANSSVTFALTGQTAAPTFSLLYGKEFTVGAASCDAAFANCTLPVAFEPKYPGVRRDVVLVRDGANNLLGRMALSGTGKGPQASVAPGIRANLSLGAVWYEPPSQFVLDSAGNAYALAWQSNQVFKISAADHFATVLAGTTTAGYSGDGGPATYAQLNAPGSLALDPAGFLFVADQGNNVIRKIDLATGIITTVAGTGTPGRNDTGPATAAALTKPFSLLVDPAGNLFFLERGDYSNVTDYKVRKLDALTQTLSVFAGTGINGDSGDNGPAAQATIDPISLGVNGNGDVYIVQQSGSYNGAGGLIRVVSGGTISRFAGSESGQAGDGTPALSTGFYDIKDVISDSGGSIYFVDGSTCCNSIRKLSAIAPNDASTVFRSSSVAVNYLIQSMAMDAAGNFYTSDNFSQAAEISTQGAPLSFPSTNAGQTSSALQLLYYNTGNDTLNISGITISGVNSSDFAQTNDCGPSVAAGTSCTITLKFLPQAMGTRLAALNISDNAPGSPRAVSLSGTGLSPQQAVLNPSRLSFGVQNAGTISAPKTITLSNPGIAALTIRGITVSDPEFIATNNCGSSLAAGAQCTITVTFSPQNNFSSLGLLTVTDNASNSPQTVTLDGTGQGATFSASVSPLYLNMGLAAIHNLGGLQIALASTSQMISIASTGTGSLAGVGYIMGGTNPADFSISGCQGTIAPQSTCSISVTFTPGAPGVRTATLQLIGYATFGGSVTGLPQTITLVGTGFLQSSAVRGGSGYLRVSADFDGDGKADFAYWRQTDGTWHIVPSSHPSAPIVQQWGLPGDVPVPGDYDGDGKADFAVWRPANGTWYIIPSSNPSSPVIRQWGLSGDIPLVGDFDGDGRTDLTVWRQATGTWFVIPTGNPGTPIIRQWGFPSDIPLVGDFDGDGRADFAVWRPSNGSWYLIPSGNPSSPLIRQWGLPTDTPVAADFDGDGKTDLAIWRPLTGTWWIIPTSSPSVPIIQQWGLSGDIPAPADFDGDGRADFAVWRPSSAIWYVVPTGHPESPFTQAWGAAQDVFLTGDFAASGRSQIALWHPDTGIWTVPPALLNSSPIIQQWGLPGDIPLLGDFDGDGKVDFTVWRPSTGTWYIIPSANPSVPIVQQWGLSGDVPLIGDFDRDGKADFIVWRPSTGTWYIIPSSHPSAPIVQQWGLPGDIPFAADYDGDGEADFIVWRPASGTWYIIPSSQPSVPFAQQWGLSGDIPVVARTNNSFRSSLIVWRPTNGTWYILGNPSLATRASGLPGDLPIVFRENFETGFDILTLWRPIEGISFNPQSGLVGQFGTPLDVPF